MKRIGTIFIILVILYSTYYDLTIGTLPNGLTQTATEQSIIEEQMELDDTDKSENEVIVAEFEPFKEVVVEPGHTVLSIVEHLHKGPISPSIQEIVHDFQTLNDGIKPEEMQVGKKYFFPLYH
ncbi:hypothetical protein [Halalkalibacter lacteus]|uniref:hypothetical protein n=1 Tax=Halalkalibacter lacteus TaxID=3090663 RepID=UPI002FC99FA9